MPFPFPFNPRLAGLSEQYRRAKHFLSLARRCKKGDSRFRNAMAAIYPVRAIVELMLEAADKQEVAGFANRHEFEPRLILKLPFYHLIEKIRIHDFHRFGCILPDPYIRQFFCGGPIVLNARGGVAAIQFFPGGPKITETGNSKVKWQRPLINVNGEFFDDDSDSYFDLCHVLNGFLSPVPDILAEFRTMLSK
jgi:hypothetical protein